MSRTIEKEETRLFQRQYFMLLHHSLTRGRATQVSLTPLSTPGVQDSLTKIKKLIKCS